MTKRQMTNERLTEVLKPHPDVENFVLKLWSNNARLRARVEQLEGELKDILELYSEPNKKTGTGTVKDNPTEGRPKALTEEQKENIRYLYSKNHSLRSLAHVYKVSHETIRKAIRGGSDRPENVSKSLNDFSLLEDVDPADHEPITKQLHPKKDKKSSEYDLETLINADPNKIDELK